MKHRKELSDPVWLYQWVALLPPQACVLDIGDDSHRRLPFFKRRKVRSVAAVEVGPAGDRPGQSPLRAIPTESLDGICAVYHKSQATAHAIAILPDIVRAAKAGSILLWSNPSMATDVADPLLGVSQFLQQAGWHVGSPMEQQGRSFLLARNALPAPNSCASPPVYTPFSLGAAHVWGKWWLEGLEQNGNLECQRLLQSLLHIPTTAFFTATERLLSLEEDRSFMNLIDQRLQRQPLAYLTGQQGFMSLDFAVSPAVLIPRPETELLVEYALQNFADRPFVGLDLGTGSGCIAISILKYLPQSQMTGVDISPAALAVAQQNARHHGVADRFTTVCGDLFTPFPLPIRSRWDLIVSNPPYIAASDYPQLMPEVQQEPKCALLAGDGLEFYRRILRQAGDYLTPHGRLALEMGYGQLQQIRRLIPPNLAEERVVSDFASIERVIILTISN